MTTVLVSTALQLCSLSFGCHLILFCAAKSTVNEAADFIPLLVYMQDLEETGHMHAASQYNELMVEARGMTAEVEKLLRESEMDEEGGEVVKEEEE